MTGTVDETDLAGARRVEPAVAEGDGIGMALEELRGGGLAGRDQGPGGDDQRAAAHVQRPGAAVPAAAGHARRIALDELEARHGQAELP